MKIVSHDGDVGHRMDVLRESLLSANIQHPNVVSTYKARDTTLQYIGYRGCRQGLWSGFQRHEVRAPQPAGESLSYSSCAMMLE